MAWPASHRCGSEPPDCLRPGTKRHPLVMKCAPLDIAGGEWCLAAMNTVVRENRLWWRTF